MKYESLVELILNLKSDTTLPRQFQIEHNDYHQNRLQPTDIDIIEITLKTKNTNKFCFAAELYCRTLLAQIIHFKYTKYFNGYRYDEPTNTNRYQFIETIGWCPSRCQRHIRPIILPLLILYWRPNAQYEFFGSDNLSDEEAIKTLEKYHKRLEEYKAEFVERIPSLFGYILNQKTPNEVRLEIINDFANFIIGLNDED